MTLKPCEKSGNNGGIYVGGWAAWWIKDNFCHDSGTKPPPTQRPKSYWVPSKRTPNSKRKSGASGATTVGADRSQYARCFTARASIVQDAREEIDTDFIRSELTAGIYVPDIRFLDTSLEATRETVLTSFNECRATSHSDRNVMPWPFRAQISTTLPLLEE